MRQSNAGLAWVERRGDGSSKWLVLWNDKWQRYSLVGGHVAPGESFRQSVRREIEEELGLQPDQDFQVGERPLARLDYEAFSESAREQTRYRIEVFPVALTEASLRRIESQPGVRWVTAQEIERGTTSDGRPIADQISRVWNEIQLQSNTEISH